MTSPTRAVLSGAVFGFALFLGETAVSVLAGDQTFLHLTLLSLLVSMLLGCSAGAGSLLVTPVIRRLRGSGRDAAPDRRHLTILTAVLMLFLQGALIINFTLLPRTGIIGAFSIILDAAWALLCSLILVFLARLSRRKPALLGGKLALGLLTATAANALLAVHYGRPFTIEQGQVVNHVLLMFGASSACFLSSFFLVELLRGAFGSSKVHRTAAGILFPAALLFASGGTLRVGTGSEIGHAPQSPRTASTPNVILIVLDTLRPDHLSCYGYERETSPNLDAFCRDAARFEHCYSTANWTVPGHASIFTGRYVVSHGAHKELPGSVEGDSSIENPFFCFPLPEVEATLAEILGGAGYRTAGFVSNHACVTSVFGLDQGLEILDARPPYTYHTVPLTILGKLELFSDRIGPYQVRFRIAENINGMVFDWLDGEHSAEKPFFLFINYMDTHDPYFPPPPYQDLFPGRIEDFRADIHRFGEEHGSVTDRQREHLVSQYDGEIAYLDAELGRLFERLKREGLYESSIIVVTSDHGEHLGEHDLYGHSLGLYDPVTKVPLMVKPPSGFTFDPEVGSPVQTIDILPTVLSLIGLDSPEAVQGEPLISGVSHPIVSEHYAGSNYRHTYGDRYFRRMTSLVEGNSKYIRSVDAQDQLFDLSADPREEVNLLPGRPESGEELLSRIESWENAVDVRAAEERDLPKLNDEALENLRALGYIR